MKRSWRRLCAITLAITGIATSNTVATEAGKSAAYGAAVGGVNSRNTLLEGNGGEAIAQSSIGQGVELAVQTCMETQGLKFLVALEPPQQSSSVLTRYGIQTSNSSQVRVEGYGLYQKSIDALALKGNTSGDIGSPTNDPESLYENTLTGGASTHYRNVLFGTSTDTKTFNLVGQPSITIGTQGCEGMGNREVFGTIANEVEATNGIAGLQNELYSKVVGDKRYIAAQKSWSVCMKSSGYSYQNPYSAQSSLASDYSKSGPSIANHQLEISTAVADSSCSQETKLTLKVLGTIADDANRLSSQQEGAALRYLQIQNAALARADALIGRSPG